MRKLQIDMVREYWNRKPHEFDVSKNPPGTIEFFRDIEEYHYRKLNYLKRIVDFNKYKGKKLLEMGCGLGTDLISFANGGAMVTGVDLSDLTVTMARKNMELQSIPGEVHQMNGEGLNFGDNSFDAVFALSTISYTPDPELMVEEIHRVLKPGGEAYLVVYHSDSWLNFLHRTFKIKLMRDDAPCFKQYSINQFRELLSCFSNLEIIIDRYPVKTNLNMGAISFLYNYLFVPTFNRIPRKFVKDFGHHIIAKAIK
jgi:ubiquinone/menaquinone biosynthesis C-methylase UbiE